MERFGSPLAAFNYWVESAADRVFLRQPVNRQFIEYTFRQANEESRKVAAALKNLGLAPGSHIAILSKNCAHWFMADLAIMMADYVSIPIYPTLGADSMRQILDHSESKAIFIGKLDNYGAQKAGIDKNIHKIGIELYGIRETLSWEHLAKESLPLEEITNPTPDDLLTIMYTSGTTGNPKGVMHQVRAFNEVANTLKQTIVLPDFPRYFSYLPLAHIGERIGVETTALYMGATVSFAESLETFAEDLESVQPQMFFGVPRIWQKFKEKILEKLPQRKLDFLLKVPVLNGLIKKKLRHKLGLSAAVAFTGAAPLSTDLQLWFARLGIQIHQVYGMTEDCLYSHCSIPGHNRVGSVGKPLPGCEAKLSPEGEILTRNKSLTIGYFKDEENTAKIFTEDGFLKTGDIGAYDQDGYLMITGRIKDQFKTDKGKYIAPSPIELELLKNTDIDQVCVVGTGIAQPIALVVPSEAGKMKTHAKLQQSLKTTLESVNEQLQHHETLAKAVVMKENWTIENGLITPSLKVKRNRVEEIHKGRYPEWFASPNTVVYEN